MVWYDMILYWRLYEDEEEEQEERRAGNERRRRSTSYQRKREAKIGVVGIGNDQLRS